MRGLFVGNYLVQWAVDERDVDYVVHRPSTTGRHPLLSLSPQAQSQQIASGNIHEHHLDHWTGAAGAVLLPEPAPTLSHLLAKNDDESTGEDPRETIERNYPQPTAISPYLILNL